MGWDVNLAGQKGDDIMDLQRLHSLPLRRPRTLTHALTQFPLFDKNAVFAI